MGVGEVRLERTRKSDKTIAVVFRASQGVESMLMWMSEAKEEINR